MATRPAKPRSLWQRIRPKGVHFSLTGCVLALFTGTSGYLMLKFPRFWSIKVWFAFLLVANTLLFLRFREGRRSFFERLMEKKFFPRKLAFTREGKFLVLISLGIGFAAVNTGSNLLYLLLAMLLSIITASGLLSELSLRKVSWDADVLREAPCRTPALFPVRLTNHKRRLNSFSLEAEVLFADRETVQQARGSCLKVSPGATHTAWPRVTFPRRGVYHCRALSVSTRYPFSFFHKSRRFELSAEILALPRADQDVRAVLHALSVGFEERSSRAGRGEEFFSVRGMMPGDEWRHVHWKQTARTARFVVKEYEALTARRVIVEIPGNGERGEDAVELAASIARTLALAGLRVGLLGPATFVPPVSGPAGTRQLLRALAVVDLDAGPAAAPAGAVSPQDTLILVDPEALTVQIRGTAGPAGSFSVSRREEAGP